MNERREPRIGRHPASEDFDDLHRRPRAAGGGRQVRRRQRAGGGPWLALAAVVLVAGASTLYLWREPISARLFPEPQQNRLLGQADAALAEGRLSAPDGRGARELYTAVLALQPDHREARDGLRRVGEAALVRAREALARDDVDAARDALALARSLALPAAELQPLDEELRRRDAQGQDTAASLEAARDAQRAGHLAGGDDSALALYEDALQDDGASAVAAAGRNEVLAGLLQQAETEMAAGDLPAAEALVERVAEADPAHVGLPAARARLAELQQAQNREGTRYFRSADQALQAGHLDRARAGYENARDAGGDARRAARGLARVAAAYAARAERAAADFRFDLAEAELAAARELAPDLPRLREAEQRVLRSRARGEDAAAVAGADPRRVDDLLEDARRAMRNGDLVDPPGDSAFDKLRAAQAAAPDDPRVARALADLRPAAIRCYENELTANSLGRAAACLDALVTLDPGDPRLPGWRDRLAARYRAVAEERLGAGELGAARRAADAARQLDPDSSALPALYARLEQAAPLPGR
ncbi:hypothetical protein [Coralloluteibacterium stylophorae]|uniref:Tetratricopeptide repeat protein n=2 Tax=Coralloluteibacterium stylophorae TaxID=1776034 RepID=A0AAP2CC00_9GAMM|nr:hypothetical protein [Coralloluteibacterium stylophorae]MBS7456757.1 hypothetical protein [Coralloluteibacterium stylophorae]